MTPGRFLSRRRRKIGARAAKHAGTSTLPGLPRITRVGFCFALLLLPVALAAANTGNNALYMVLAVMLGMGMASLVVMPLDLRPLEVEVSPPPEIFATRPFGLSMTLRNPSRWWPRWLLTLSLPARSHPLLVPFLPRRGVCRGTMEVMLSQRGRHRLGGCEVATLFPFGFFRGSRRYPTGLEVLVYPEVFPSPSASPPRSGRTGEGVTRRRGWGHDLHALRDYRHGDDPRSIHWKQTARTGKIVFMEREAEEGRRLSIVFDNAVGELTDPAEVARFERLVSEAATAALHYLNRGYEVELVTRDRRLPFAGGVRQRRAILEALALVEPSAPQREPLKPQDEGAPQLRLAMEAGRRPA